MNQTIRNRVENITVEHIGSFEELSIHLFNHPELSDQEFESARYLADYLKKNGFEVEESYCGLPTAFKAVYSNGDGPTIALLAEYDALPGYYEDKRPAHACGHNWIAASTIGTAVVLKELQEDFKGTVVVLGTPSEETVGRKVDMIDRGAFEGIDAVLQMHLENETCIETRGLAMDAIEFSFKGKASHAASNPHDGINALDAVNLTFAGINALRQHLKSDVRVHGIITEGGQAPNIVPDSAACRFYVRAFKRSDLKIATERVINCAKGAELMTGAVLTHRYFENHFDDLINNDVLKEVMHQQMIHSGIEYISTEPEAFPGSSDIGNVSYVCPTCYVNIGVGDGPAVHEQEFLPIAIGEMSFFRLRQAISSMALTAIELDANRSLVAQMWEEFNRK
ncbi:MULTISPECIES: M20 family metallopeptidase [unclassified Fusibacter]|uniref:M20 family metallopeptidase n=1 Tax=unclassified Fusibacter TaxID=2624464 RepID=UPI0010114DF2|nr:MULTISPECIES: M20 family metallopeptidase [unclassified Fusibacter]MCK8060099.1 M20 family metallopeptidase [Fusibacter sp. A2]NPE22241.1 M20 family metallopeptidase [Fusibacter sp. A1]RXV61015.1 M20 family peptidase [Fusibacter sp. A1]